MDQQDVFVRNIALFEQEMQLHFENPDWLREAFTHSSYINEQKRGERTGSGKHNERLEFLGDAVLQLLVSRYLFEKFPDCPEGELSRMRAAIVREPALAHFAKMANLVDYIVLGRGEEKLSRRERPALLADLFEAVVGAIYLDQGLAQVRVFLNRWMYPYVNDELTLATKDHKTTLQELVQPRSVVYHIIKESGPSHDREFTADVTIDNEQLGIGVGRSKKEAEQQAAAVAAQKLIAESTAVDGTMEQDRL
jgi:ribonuclease-3